MTTTVTTPAAKITLALFGLNALLAQTEKACGLSSGEFSVVLNGRLKGLYLGGERPWQASALGKDLDLARLARALPAVIQNAPNAETILLSNLPIWQVLMQEYNRAWVGLPNAK